VERLGYSPITCRIKGISRYLASKSIALGNDMFAVEILRKRRKHVLKMAADRLPDDIKCKSTGG